MNANDHIRLLQQIHDGIDDILWAPEDTPEKIDVTPAVIIRSDAMAASVIGAGESCLAVVCSYHVFLLAGFAGESTFGVKAAKAYTIADEMLTEYHRASVEGLPGVDPDNYPRLIADDAAGITHSGLIRFAFNENNVFTAIRFALRIEDQRDWPVP